jgi:hypothetical protein
LRRQLHQLGNRVGGSGEQAAFQQNDVGGEALQGGAKAVEGVHLGDHPDIVFHGEDLAHAHAIDRLRVGENDADDGGVVRKTPVSLLGWRRFVEQLRVGGWRQFGHESPRDYIPSLKT